MGAYVYDEPPEELWLFCYVCKDEPHAYNKVNRMLSQTYHFRYRYDSENEKKDVPGNEQTNANIPQQLSPATTSTVEK